jgi:ketohexokinase
LAHILTIGIATVDIINSVDSYPREDDEVRASFQRIHRGGNAANTAVVLAQLGHRCSWAGTLSDDADSDFIVRDLHQYDIDTSASCRINGGRTPTSYITHNRQNGCRTIVHYRDLPEYSFDNFSTIDLASYDWLHIEGRHCQETARMLRLVRQQYPQLPVSIEIEKPRPDIECLFELADLLLFSRVFAQNRGYQEGAEFLQAICRQVPAADCVCAWGEKGAYALEHNQQSSFSPAFPPAQLVDTLAAGDTFNAGIIDARCQGLPLSAALTAACRLAGRKCGVAGLELLK